MSRRKNPFVSFSFRLTATIFAVALGVSYLSIFFDGEGIFSVVSLFGLYYIPLLVVNIVLLVMSVARRSSSFLIPMAALLPSLYFLQFYIKVTDENLPGWKSASELGVTMMTYNVGKFKYASSGNPEDVLAQVAGFVEQYDPDIIAFQEFYITDSDAVEDCFRDYPYCSKYLFRTSSGSYFGNVTFSKFPIKSSGKIKFDGSTNLVLYSDMDINGQMIRIYNQHLESNSISLASLVKKISGRDDSVSEEIMNAHERLISSNERRGRQVRTLLDHVAKSDRMAVLCGDVNDTPMSSSFRALRMGRKDTFTQAGNGFGASYSVLWPLLRIDYIFVPDNFDVLLHITPKVGFSDHYPVLTSFIINDENE